MENLLHIENCSEFGKRFDEIAKELMCNLFIQKGGSKYAIVEIEFYLQTPGHHDVITYPRNLPAGRWFFHQSGVDLTFDSKSAKISNGVLTNPDNATFGGILIRGIYDLDSHKYTFGPQKCVNELWQNLDAFSETANYPVIKKVTEKQNITNALIKCPRCINFDSEKVIVKVKEWRKRVGLNEELDDVQLTQELEKVVNAKYRYFNLQQDEDPTTFTKIPSSARPKTKPLPI